MIHPIHDSDEFRIENNKQWKENTEYWLQNWTIDEKIIGFVRAKICKLQKTMYSDRPFVIADVGCGSAWVLEFILQSVSFTYEYIGIDSNLSFITHLRNKFGHLKNCIFLHKDIEKESFAQLSESVDLIINTFSLIENPDLSIVYEKMNLLLKKNANLLILTLNPIFQILRINTKSFSDFLQDIQKFRDHECLYYYRKEISFHKNEKKQKYFGILHPINSYIDKALEVNLNLMFYYELKAQGADVFSNTYVYFHFKKS